MGGGQVYTQGEFRKHDNLLSRALGQSAPENIVQVPWEAGFRYWVVEAKRNHDDRDLALEEAKDYAERINTIAAGSARFATGIGGTPQTSFYVSTSYWDGSEWSEVAINNYETTGFLTHQQCQNILDRNNPHILDYDVDLDLFLAKANEINESLHRNGVQPRDRAKLVAGLLLALAQDSALRITDEAITLVSDVNARIRVLLEHHNKGDFRREVELKLPANNENHRKYWSAIVETMQHLREMNIRSAINSGTDALGQFYETFLKYANDAKQMGIVLTPRHITKFAVDVLDVHHEHAIYDPTCGTGGFLVAALDSIRAKHQGLHGDVYNRFRNDYLHGVEQADDVYGLALVNMIFRGDGKSRIYNGNCFDSSFVRHNGKIHRLKRGQHPPSDSVRPFARVLMNPPYALSEPEHAFVNHALEQTAAGGLLFAVLPNALITGLQAACSNWRKELVKRHTVRAVLKMQRNLFHPSADKVTYVLILQAWRPHQSEDEVFFALLYDNANASRLSKFIGTFEARDNVDRLTRELKAFMAGVSDAVTEVPTESGVRPLRMQDDCDFAPEAHLGNHEDTGPTPPEGLFVALTRRTFRQPPQPTPVPSATREYDLDALFKITRGTIAAIKSLPPGNIPVVTTTEHDNGIEGYYEVSPAHTDQDAITITANGGCGRAFWHPYPFAATGDVHVCLFRSELGGGAAFKLYVCDAINRHSWRFSWSRKCGLQRLLRDVRISLPMDGDRIDFKLIERTMNRAPGFPALLGLLDEE